MEYCAGWAGDSPTRVVCRKRLKGQIANDIGKRYSDMGVTLRKLTYLNGGALSFSSSSSSCIPRPLVQ
eukprot:272911-Pyramimonas_sp.AAC.1